MIMEESSAVTVVDVLKNCSAINIPQEDEVIQGQNDEGVPQDEAATLEDAESIVLEEVMVIIATSSEDDKLGTDTITDTSVRRSRRLEGLEPRFDTDEKKKPIRKINPTVFSGNGTEDCGKWIKDYERIARSNGWDATMKLANAPFFLEGTAGQWYDNNEEGMDSWDMFKEMFSRTFDNSGVLLRRAKDNLQSRAQRSTESCESYIQDVLSLCRQVNPDMSKEEKVAHLMKGVVEDVYQVVLIKEIDTVEAFVDCCRKVEACKQRRIGKPRFERLPNVASIEQPNSSSLEDLIRRIVREEIKSALHSESIVPEVNSLKKIIHEEVERNLTPIAEEGPYYREQRRQFEGPAKPPPYYQQQSPTRLTTARRKTEEWRTVDNIPVCFQCGRPGHVARYCRERRGMVDRQPPGRYHPVQNGPRTIYNSNETPGRASYRSPSPYPGRGRSPAERRPSISPSRRSGRSPYQQAPFSGGKVAEEIINPPPLIAAKLSQNIVDVTIDDKTFPALVDSGASFSVISDHFRQQHKKTMFSDAGMTLRVADGKYIVSRGRCTLRLEINGLVQPFEFIVLPSCSHDIILGWDFLEASRAIIDCGSAEILLEKAELPEDSSSIFQTVAADDSFIIPAGSTKQINVISEAILGVSDVVMEPSRILFLERDLMVPASIFAVQHGKGRIWITNIGECDRTVPKGMCIGEIQVLEEGQLAVIGDASDTNRQGILGQENSPNITSMISPDLSMLERTRICSILGSFSGLFEFSKFPSNLTSTAKHKINTEDHPPIKRRPYRVSQVERQTIQNEVDKMLKGGIVQLSESPWSSPVVLVKKKNGSWRFCVDYRHLNKITKKDVYPLPRIDDTLDCLRGASYYSSMDLRSGYWQIEVDEADREKTAFITPDGLYEFKVMPFGLCNAPATFERMMDTLMRGLKWSMCLCYLGDIIVFSPTFDEHVRRLELVLRCLSKAGLVLNPDKCLFGTKRLSIFGHLVDGEGVHPDPGKVDAMSKFPTPKSLTDVRSFIGMCSYYRRFIKNFAQKAEPLHRLLRKDTRFEWGPDQRQAYESLKLALASEPVLAHFDEKYATELHTDASGFGIGAVLVQVQGGSEKPIGYASRTLSTAEKNYSTTERECLAAIWAIGKFRPYLFGRSFTIVTDHHSLCWLSGLKDPVGIDLLGRFPISHLGNKWIIVCTDYLTRYAITRALPSADAQQVAKFVLEDVVLKHGAPREIITDRGRRFTTAYHPQTNGLTERLNKTLADMMSMYVDVEQKEWDVILPFITTPPDSPHSGRDLIYGREAETTLDTLFPLLKDEDQEDYNREIVTRAEETRQLARIHTLRAQEGNKRLYDAKHREVSYQPGDKVWIFIPVRKIGISEKLIKRYFGPYRVTRRISDVTYEVESLDTTNRRRKPKEIVHVVRMKNYRDPDEQLDLPEDEPTV
ncbi:K02A2.6-like [Cordylochernes scorpioides]|uniref:K02A2.6-like n=1 Tax=Cordylochernes scorpioides TaxID=51811 RepID=A0ABY6LW27_9ARAC|nr:K02A2.6-like [Cordylochernes scorpioides]